MLGEHRGLWAISLIVFPRIGGEHLVHVVAFVIRQMPGHIGWAVRFVCTCLVMKVSHMNQAVDESLEFRPRWGADDLLTAVAVDAATGAVIAFQHQHALAAPRQQRGADQ